MANEAKKTIRAEVTDPCTGTKVIRHITDLKPVKAGLLGRLVGSGYNVFRPWDKSEWFTNITSSTRFNMETEGMTQEEIGVFLALRNNN